MKGISLMDVVEADQEKRQVLESTLVVGPTTSSNRSTSRPQTGLIGRVGPQEN